MTDLMRYAAALEDAGGKGLPPVHRWNPEFTGDIDLVIKRDGSWCYEGSPITRARLVRLFSTVLKREDEDFFLVTPVEKLRIKVEDVPFIAPIMRSEGAGEKQRLFFKTNVGDEVLAGPDHEIDYRKDKDGKGAPYLHIRAGLEARIARPVFYDLVALGEIHHIDGEKLFGVWSDGEYFPFDQADEVFAQE